MKLFILMILAVLPFVIQAEFYEPPPEDALPEDRSCFYLIGSEPGEVRIPEDERCKLPEIVREKELPADRPPIDEELGGKGSTDPHGRRPGAGVGT